MRLIETALTVLVLALFCTNPIFAQNGAPTDSLGGLTFYTDEYLDTVNIKKKFVINDYSMIGFEYGVSMINGRFTPNYDRTMTFTPVYTGVTFTHYQKMYGRHPYFGYELGIFYSKQGYCFTEKSGYTIYNANKAVYDIVEVPAWAVIHFDAPHVKFMVNLGPYGGYRLSIHRSNTYAPELAVSYRDNFAPEDRRFDYGLSGGVGAGLVFAPLELHVNLRTRFSMSEFFTPDSYMDPVKQTWFYAYPWDFMLSAGIRFHLTKRTGRGTSVLKAEAKRRIEEKKSVENQ